MKPLALALIRAYQRFISPYKGYSCAWRLHTGGHSCSTFGYRAIQKAGLIAGLRLLRRRFRQCASVHRQYHPAHPRQHLALPRAQLGHCDVPCHGGDFCSAHHLSELGDWCYCCPCDGWGNRGKRGKRK